MIDLNLYRNKRGLINLDKISGLSEMEEPRGNAPKKWVILPDGKRVLFREPFRCDFKYGNYNLMSLIPYEMYSSLIEAEMANCIGVPSAQYDLAIYKGRMGTITWDFLHENETFISGEEIIEIALNSQDYIDSRLRGDNILVSNYYGFLELTKDEETARNMSVEFLLNFYTLDFVSTESDRSPKNWGAIYNGQIYRLAPRYDSDSIARAYAERAEISRALKGYKKNRDEIIFKDNFYRDYFLVYFNLEKSNKNMSKDFAEFCKCEPELAKKFFELVSKIDIFKVFKNVEKKIAHHLPREYKEWLGFVTNYQLYFYKTTLNNTRNIGNSTKSNKNMASILRDRVEINEVFDNLGL